MNKFQVCKFFVMAVAISLLLMLGCSKPRHSFNYNAGSNHNAASKPSPTPSVERVPTPYPDPKIDRKYFSMMRPTSWREEVEMEMYDPDRFVTFDRGSSSNSFFQVIIGKKSEGAAADKIVNRQRDEWLKNMPGAQVEEFTRWGNYEGQGFDINGKVSGQVFQNTRLFVVTKGDTVCLITESAPPSDFMIYVADFKTIRESFKLK